MILGQGVGFRARAGTDLVNCACLAGTSGSLRQVHPNKPTFHVVLFSSGKTIAVWQGLLLAPSVVKPSLANPVAEKTFLSVMVILS